MAIFHRAVNQWLVSLVGDTAIGKVAIFFIAWALLWLPIAIIMATIVKWHPPEPLKAEQKLPLLAGLYLIAPPIIWGASWVEGVSFSEYGLEWNISLLLSLGLGLILGIVSLAIAFAGESVVGWVVWHWENWQLLLKGCLPILLLGLWIGFTEELVFRGFLVNQLQEDYSIWLTGVISSGIFALLHLIWEQEETLPQLPGLWVMGVILVLARWVDRGSLGLAWGLHAGWICGLTCLDSAKFISYTGKGPVWMTGFKNNPLAGIIGFLCMLGVGGVLVFMLSTGLWG